MTNRRTNASSILVIDQNVLSTPHFNDDDFSVDDLDYDTIDEYKEEDIEENEKSNEKNDEYTCSDSNDDDN